MPSRPRSQQSQSQGAPSHGAPQDEYFESEDFEGAGADSVGSDDDESYDDLAEGGEGADETPDEGEDVSAQDLGPQRQRRRQPQDNQEDDLRAQLQRLQHENELLRRTAPQAPVQSGPREESDAEFNQRMAALDPVEAMAERQQRAERRNQNQLLYLQASTQDALDRAQFQMRAASDARFSRHADEVERRHQALLMGGPNQAPALVPREQILKQLLGERLLSSSNRSQGRQPARRQGEDRQENRQQPTRQGRPLNTRGDSGGRQQRMGPQETEREARRKRLENLEI